MSQKRQEICDFNTQINPYTLRFHDEYIESNYQVHYFNGFLLQFRGGLLLAAFLYLIFYFLDTQIIPSICSLSLVIRIAVVAYCLAILTLSFTKYFKEHAQNIIISLSLIGGFGIILMIAMSEDQRSHTYYAGLILTILCTVLVFRVRFVTSIVIALTTLLTYEVVAYNKAYESGIFLSNNFFLITCIVLSLFTSYYLERYDRKIFTRDILEARLRERERTIETIFSLIHSGPLQTLAGLIRNVNQGQHLKGDDLMSLVKLNQEIRDINNLLTQEVIYTNHVFLLSGKIKISLDQPLDELLYEVYQKSLERSFPGFQSIKIRIPSFDLLPSEIIISEETKSCLCSFLEEALCNVGKHAMGATKIVINGKAQGGHYFIQVIDNGPGLGIERVGNGTRTFQQIAQRLDGEFKRCSLDSGGTLCELKIPLNI